MRTEDELRADLEAMYKNFSQYKSDPLFKQWERALEWVLNDSNQEEEGFKPEKFPDPIPAFGWGPD